MWPGGVQEQGSQNDDFSISGGNYGGQTFLETPLSRHSSVCIMKGLAEWPEFEPQCSAPSGVLENKR